MTRLGYSVRGITRSTPLYVTLAARALRQLRGLRAPFQMAAAFALAFGCAPTFAQTYPNKMIKFVIAQSPGSTTDIVARTVGDEMAKVLSQPILMENKLSANGLAAFEYVARDSPADGYTVLASTIASLATVPVLVKELRFQPLQDLVPFINLAEGKYTYVSSASVPWSDFKGLIAYAKANPGKLNYGSNAPSVRMMSEVFMQELGLNIVRIDYTAAGLYLNALAVGEVHMGIAAEPQAIAFGDKVKVLAVTGRQRSKAFPDVPTFAELGFPQIPSLTFALSVKTKTPKHIVDTLYSAAVKALQQPEVRSRFEKLRFAVLGDSQESAASRLADEAKLYADIATKIGIKPQ